MRNTYLLWKKKIELEPNHSNLIESSIGIPIIIGTSNLYYLDVISKFNENIKQFNIDIYKYR